MHIAHSLMGLLRVCAGAGKSTLLDTLAMQLPEGTVTGDITVNGQHMSRTMFRSISTYVPQVGSRALSMLFFRFQGQHSLCLLFVHTGAHGIVRVL